jgi:hypothetical protein
LKITVAFFEKMSYKDISDEEKGTLK